MLSIDALIQDLRYGLRLVGKAPLFTAVAVASLAVGIGASTFLFSLANSFLFRPIHAAHPERLVQLFTSNSDGGLYGSSSYPDYEDLRDLPVFDGLLASARAAATLSDAERPDVLSGLLVSANYFEVLGLHASRGRLFRADEDDAPGAQPVVVLSHDAWRRRFGSDPAVVGRAVGLNGRPFTVIGVGPPQFAGTSIEFASDFFVPARMQELIAPGTDTIRNRQARVFRVFGRLAPGITVRQVESGLRVAAARLLRHDPVAWRDRAGRGRVMTALPETAARFAGAPPGALTFIYSGVAAGVVALLAIACVNVATVLLARATTRRRELAIRLALGASRRRVVGQLLTECALLAAAGGVLGVLIAQSAGALFVRFRPDGVPPFDLALDSRILLFGIAASALTALLCGLAPALHTTRPDVHAELKDAPRAVRVRGFRLGLRAGLVVIQVAVSLALMAGAGLMLRSAHAGRTADPGFRRQDVLSIGIDLSTVPDRKGSHARFYEEAVRSAAGLAGIERVALAALVPLDGSNIQATFRIADGRSMTVTSPDINIVGPGYFALLDIPVKQGREFTAADRASAPLVAVVNEAMAQQFWNGDPAGRAMTDEDTGEAIHVVGVVRDTRHRSFIEDARPMVYLSAAQRIRHRMVLHVRTAAPPHAVGSALQRALHEIDLAAGLTPAETMTEYFDRVTQPQRLAAAGTMATAGLELALVVMALYGVIAYAVAQRRREIGLRIALGAPRRAVMALVVREGLLLTAVGTVLGLGVALLGGAALRGMLIGIGWADPVTFGAAILVILLVGAAASYVPARRALSIDPGTALRSE